ncbi:MAG TPA: phosphatase PAP2 family protein [Aldersonia sp.]
MRLLALSAALAFVALALVAHHAAGPTEPDDAVLGWFVDRRTGWLTVVALVVTNLFSPAAAWVGALTFGALSWRRTRSLAALALATATLGAALTVNSVTKLLVQRPRPPLDLQLVYASGYAYPSGHTTGTLAFTGIIAVMLCRDRSRRARIVAALLVALATVAVALTRLYLGVHWLTDVCGGALLAGSVLAAGAWATGRYLRRPTSVAQVGEPDPCNLRNSRPIT